MTVRQFAEVTAKVAAADYDGYQPTIVSPSDNQVAVVSGIPLDVEQRVALQESIVLKGLQNRELFFGVRLGESLVVGHYRPGKPTEFARIFPAEHGLQIEDAVSCDWWTINNSGEDLHNIE